MYSRLLRNDIRKSKTITLTTTLFVAAAAMLVALAAVLVVNLVLPLSPVGNSEGV